MSALFARQSHDSTSDWETSREALGLDENGHPYVPSPWWILHWLLPRSEMKPSDVFVEYGCGKGRVVLAAARRYPFSEVVGVELSDDLAATARKLVARDRRLRASRVRVETADATEFETPDGMTHAYMFNPFRGEAMARVCANIAASLVRAPRRIRLIYIQPEEHNAIVSAGFRLERQVRTTRLVGVNAAIYTAG